MSKKLPKITINHRSKLLINEQKGGICWIIPFNKILVQQRSKYHSILIADTPSMGKILWLDAICQSIQNEEYIYHEMLVHPALIISDRPEKILICGGGEGAVLRETLKYKDVKSVTMVDIDKKLVSLSMLHLKSWHKGSFRNPKVKLIFQDAYDFLANNTQKFDVILLDFSSSARVSKKDFINRVYSPQFYEMIKRTLTKKGIVASMLGTIDITEHKLVNEIKVSFSEFCSHFLRSFLYKPPDDDVIFALASNDSTSAIMYNSKKVNEIRWLIDSRIKKRIGGTLKYYDALIHICSFTYGYKLLFKNRKTGS